MNVITCLSTSFYTEIAILIQGGKKNNDISNIGCPKKEHWL